MPAPALSRRRLLRAAAIGLPLVAASLKGALASRPAPAHANATTLARDGDTLVLTNGLLTARCDLGDGALDLEWDGVAQIRRGYAAVTLDGDDGVRPLLATAAARHAFTATEVEDALGHGIALELTHEFDDDSVVLRHTLTVYDTRPYALVRAEVARAPGVSGAAVATRRIEALAAGGMTEPAGVAALDQPTDPRLYRMPFDNNEDIAVPPAPAQQGVVSYWLTALFDGATGAGLVAGATESRVWKSAVWYDGPGGAVSLFSGVRSPSDRADHAVRRGDRVASAEFLVGGYRNYQDGLADLMHVISVREPPLPAPDLPPPLGWNPWYQYQFRADEGIVRAIADFLADGWATLGFRYVNLDAGWFTREGEWRAHPERFPSGMTALAADIHERGLLAGSYFVPFAIHAALADVPIPGTPYTLRDAVLKDDRGEPLPAHILTWCYVLDGTHPGARAFLYDAAAGIAADGFDFVKLDFLHLGTAEGRRYDPGATAMEAFHRGMEAVRDGFATAGRPIYLSAAIAPLYVHAYAHARRVGNDVNFGQAREAGNVALSWFTDLLYHRNDPDNVVVRDDWYPAYPPSVARMHATMAALGGTLFILGDDPRYLSRERADLLTAPEIVALAREGVSARPLDVRETPAPVWVARRQDGATVLALFNWSEAPARHAVDLARLGLDPARPYRAGDLWNPEAAGQMLQGVADIEVAPSSAALLRISE